MSIVAVHGPNTFGVGGVTGGGSAGSIDSTPTGGGTVSVDLSNGMKFNFAGAGARIAADYDWTFTGETAQPNTQTGTVTFSSGGAKTITLTIPAGAGPPAGPQAYTFAVTATATAMPRMAKMSADEGSFDPGDHTIPEVEEYVNAHPDEVDDVLAAEEEGKARVTLITWLEDFIP